MIKKKRNENKNEKSPQSGQNSSSNPPSCTPLATREDGGPSSSLQKDILGQDDVSLVREPVSTFFLIFRKRVILQSRYEGNYFGDVHFLQREANKQNSKMPCKQSQQGSLFTNPITGGATAYKFLEKSQEKVCLSKK